MSGKNKKKMAQTPGKKGAKNDTELPIVVAPSIVENKAKRARVIKPGQKVTDIIKTGRNTDDLSKLHDWRIALSRENQAKWTLSVEKAESENMDFMIRICNGENNVIVYSPTMRVRTALIYGVGVLGRADAHISQRKYKLKCIGLYDEDLLEINQKIVDDFNEFTELMEQAKYTFFTLVIFNDTLYEKWIEPKEAAMIELRPDLEGKNCRDDEDMRELMIKSLIRECYTWDKGYQKAADDDPTYRFSKNVFVKGMYGGDQEESGDANNKRKDPESGVKFPDNKKGKVSQNQPAKPLTGNIIKSLKGNNAQKKGKQNQKEDDKGMKFKSVSDRKETMEIIDEAKALGLKRTIVRVTNNTDGRIICPKGYEHDVMFNPLEQNDYVRVLFAFKPYLLNSGNHGITLPFDNRGLVFMRKGKGRDEWQPFVKETGIEAQPWNEEEFIARERKRMENSQQGNQEHKSNEDNGKQNNNGKKIIMYNSN